jgi:hypothetical protein
VVYDLDALFRGEQAVVASFPMPWPDEDRGLWAVHPGGAFAVFSGVNAVRAVHPSGDTRWEYGHACWCGGSSGSVAVTTDGRYVWATVPGPHEPPREYAEGEQIPEYAGDEWLVLDARTGRLVAREVLDCAAAGSHHLPHPDGRHMALGVGEGQDGVPMYWGRLENDRLRVWTVGDRDRAPTDIHPNGLSFLSVDHGLDDVAWHVFPGGRITAKVAADDVGPDGYFDHQCGYVDANTVIVSASCYAESPQETRHWLIRAARECAAVDYPQPVQGSAQALGNGTWLTTAGDRLYRWAAEDGKERWRPARRS